MTQHKRSIRFQEISFASADELPPVPPNPWIDYMMNRYFKDKVIAFVCENIQNLIKPNLQRKLIVDFKGQLVKKIYISEIFLSLEEMSVNIFFGGEKGRQNFILANEIAQSIFHISMNLENLM